MKFHFCAANHSRRGADTLGEMYQWFSAGLLDLGHTTTFSLDSVDRSAVNLFWEYFPSGFSEVIERSGIEYGIIATEIPDGEGFNWRREAEWIDRWNGFHRAASAASFIWTTVRSAVPYYATFAPTVFLEFGHSPRLENPDWQWSNCRQDFCFYGIRTPYRLQVLEQLRQHASIEWPETFLTFEEVRGLLSRSRVCINFKQSPNWPIPSPTRLGQVLHSRRWAACEYTAEDTKQSLLLEKCPQDDDFVGYCLGLLETDLEARSAAAFDAYRRTLPMKDVMEAALDTTLAYMSRAADGPLSELHFPFPVRSLGTYRDYNLVEFKRRIWGVAQSIGPIDLDAPNMPLTALRADGLIVIGADIDTVKREIDVSASRSPLRVRFLETYRAHNLVKFEDKIWGVAQSIGPIDLAAPHVPLSVLEAKGLIVVGADTNAVKRQIDKASPA